MDTVRYWAAALIVITIPPAVVYWYIAHPLAAFWRRAGMGVTYTVLIGSLALGMVLLALARDTLVVGDLGTQPILIALGLALYVRTIVVERQVRKHLSFRTLVGVPELKEGEPEGGKLLDQGPYGRVRHPRYGNVLLGTLAVALIANYVSGYVVTLLTLPGLYGIAVLEERELNERFGSAYAEYSERVPRFFPRGSG